MFVFDLDNTLLDTREIETHTFLSVTSVLGCSPDTSSLAGWVSDAEAFHWLGKQSGLQVEKVTELWLTHLKGAIEGVKGVRTMPRIRHLLGPSGKEKVILTGSHSRSAMLKISNSELAEHNWRIIGCEVAHDKAKALKMLVAEFNCDIQYIGDSLQDRQACLDAGAEFCDYHALRSMPQTVWNFYLELVWMSHRPEPVGLSLP